MGCEGRRGRARQDCCDDGPDPPEDCFCDEVYCADEENAWCLYGPDINYSVSGEIVGAASNYDEYVPCYTVDRHPLEPDHYFGCGSTPTYPNWPPPSSFDCGWADQAFSMTAVDIGFYSCTFQATLSRARSYCPSTVYANVQFSATGGDRTKLTIVGQVLDTLYGLWVAGDIGLEEIAWTDCESQTFEIPLVGGGGCSTVQMCTYPLLKVTLTRIV